MAPATELVVLGEEELVSRLTESRRELLNLRFQLATGQLDNPARIGHVRREVARILTVLRQRELAEIEGRPLPAPAASRRAPAEERPRRSRRQAEEPAAEANEEPAVDDAGTDVEEEA